MTTRNRIVAVLAAGAFALVSVSAAAASDPDTATTPTVKQEAAKPALSRKALNMVWCVAKKDEAGVKECKTRAKWIAEGKDPFSKN